MFLPILIPMFMGLALLKYKIRDHESLTKYAMLATGISSITTIVTSILFYNKQVVFARFPFGIEFILKIDEITVFFSIIFAIIWFLATIYSFEYMKHSKRKNRFYAFFISSLGGLVGVSYAGNIVTLYMFFEIMSLLSYVLVIQERTKTSLLAGRKYIYYSITGASFGLIGIFYLSSLGVDTTFTVGGISGINENPEVLQALTFISIIGFGCKAGLFPLHGWLATAHPVAPAPASSVLSGLITKAGIIAIIRIVYFTVGVEILQGTVVQYAILGLSLLTIFMGSMLAYRENILKKRLAYSTVSQVSYIIFGLFLFNKIAFVGALLQVVYHALAKNLLFLGAGTIIHCGHVEKCSELRGLGGSMKKTFMLYTIGGLSLVGVPFTAGFVSKWYLAEGALSSNMDTLGIVGVAIIMISALLTAGYLLSTTAISLFAHSDDMKTDVTYVPRGMLFPMVVLAVLIIVFGIYPKPIIEISQMIAHVVFGGSL
ncbi:MAG: proton-conducting transporter membrane subunit [Clostridia bacterium]